MSKGPIPQAPRAMLRQGGAFTTTLFEEISKELYPKMVLFQALAGCKDDPQRRETSGDAVFEARRDFLDSFAYLCDIEKGGATVTAAALQKLPLSNILWLAANEGISQHIQIYAGAILAQLKNVDVATEQDVQDEVFRLAMMNCTARIEFYATEVQRYARNCRMQLRRETLSDIVRILRSRLKRLSEPRATMTRGDFVDLCYSMRGEEVNAIRARSRDSRDDFGRLTHTIGRLGATRSAAITVVKSAIRVPSIRQISTIRFVDAPGARVVELDPAQSSPYEIVRDICQRSASQNPVHVHAALHAIVVLDMPPNAEIRKLLADRRTVVTRVHAELQMADAFSRDKSMEFVDSDKYIGCSKPACYFCFTWLSNHRHNYVLPATHHKIIPGCRGPDIGINESGAVVLRDMYKKTCGVLDQDIIDFLLRAKDGGPLHRYHYMSTEGSSRAPSQISTNPM